MYIVQILSFTENHAFKYHHSNTVKSPLEAAASNICGGIFAAARIRERPIVNFTNCKIN